MEKLLMEKADGEVEAVHVEYTMRSGILPKRCRSLPKRCRRRTVSETTAGDMSDTDSVTGRYTDTDLGGDDLIVVKLESDENEIRSTSKVRIPRRVLENPGDLPFLGQGSFGSVHLYEDPFSTKLLAIKQIKAANLLSLLSEQEIKELFRETRLHKKLKHRNIVRYFGVHHGINHISIILEHAVHGSLKDCLRSLKREGRKLTDQLVLTFTRQIVCGLQYLHSRQEPIIHRDLRAANILVFPEDTVKIADFGISKQLDAFATKSEFSTLTGNAYWQAPELMEGDKSKTGRKVDVWSLAIVILEMSCINPGHPIFDMEHFQYMYGLCSRKVLPEIPEFVDEKLKRLLKMCLVYNAKGRATAENVLNAIDDKESTGSLTQGIVKRVTRIKLTNRRLAICIPLLLMFNYVVYKQIKSSRK